VKVVYHLGTCSTCKRIIDSITWPADISFIDIKKQAITAEALELLKAEYGTYEAVFSKKAKRYSEVKASISCDEDYKSLILSDYTFLKRPAIIYSGFFSVGNDRSSVERLQENFNAC
jgi:arsenate reductase